MAERGMVKRGAAAMLNSRAWPVVFQAGSAEVLAEACLTAALSDRVVVPKEPTSEMFEAAMRAYIDDNDEKKYPDFFAKLYRAMIAAAPPREVESE